jgi:hypothetical protein
MCTIFLLSILAIIGLDVFLIHQFNVSQRAKRQAKMFEKRQDPKYMKFKNELHECYVGFSHAKTLQAWMEWRTKLIQLEMTAKELGLSYQHDKAIVYGDIIRRAITLNYRIEGVPDSYDEAFKE